jgi:hypothetical protein
MNFNIFKFYSAAALFLSFLVACRKQATNTSKLDSNIEQHNKDANNYKGELDATDNDINGILRGNSGLNKLEEGYQFLSSPLCGCTIDSSQMAQKILFFNFDGTTSCFSPSRLRSGQIKVQLTSGSHWDNAGAVITETFINYKITRQSDNKSITFNGVKKLTNVNGNNWISVYLGASNLKYRERAFNIDVTFDNNQHATWNSARTTEWGYTAATQKITFTAKGDTSLNGFSNVDSWGLNRFGDTFTTYYNTPVTSNTYCGFWRFLSGELVHHLDNADYTLTLGVDQNGSASTGTCAYGYKVAWNVGGNANSVVLSY